MPDKKVIYIAVFIVVLIGILFIINTGNNETKTEIVESETAGEWINIELKDVKTQEKFKINDFSDKPVLLESFAVWCPTCTQQQKEIKKLHDEVGNRVVSISLDTDPNEDEVRVKEHIEENGFNWYYAVSPVELTQALIDQFGIDIVNAPSAPVILICNNEDSDTRQLARQLSSGIKSVSELKEELTKGC